MQQKSSSASKRASTALFVFLIIVLVAGAIVPIFTNQLGAPAPAVQPTTVPTATFPAPPATTAISFDQLYLHPSGLFAIAQPTGWTPSAPISDSTRAAVTMTNNESLSVVEATVEPSDVAGLSIDDLSARFDDTYLSASWARYGAWEETARRTEGDRLLIDFNLTLNRQQYIARQISWTDGEWVYSTRAVTPANANQVVVYLVNGLADSLIPFKQFVGTPFEWTSHYDAAVNHVIRFPQGWGVVDTVAGGPTSIVGTSGDALRLERVAGGNVADEAAAEAFVSQRQPNATVLSVSPVERGTAAGFSVAYAYTTADGDPQSGLTVLLNADNGLHVANLRFAGANVDLNALDSAEAAPEATAEATAEVAPAASADEVRAQVMSTFSLLPVTLNLAGADATPTPLPTTDAAAEATEEDAAATESAEEAEAVETEAADEDAEAVATAEAEATEASE